MTRCLRKNQEVFAIDICKVSDDSKPNSKETMVVEVFLANLMIYSLKGCHGCHLKERQFMLSTSCLV